MAAKATAAAAMILLAAFVALDGRSDQDASSLAERAPSGRLAVRPDTAADVPSTLGAANDASLVIPVSGVGAEQLTDTFTHARADGIRRHDAIDILAPRGTPVLAAAAGRVEKLFLSREGGNTIYVRSPDGRRIYYYAHLDSYAPGLREGMAVRAGEAIGAVGFTGNADPAAPHLHFAIWVVSPRQPWWQEGLALNPYPFLMRRVR